MAAVSHAAGLIRARPGCREGSAVSARTRSASPGNLTTCPRGVGRRPPAAGRPVQSSPGSGALAAHLAPLAVGTETDGVVVRTASACGIAAVEPTLGLISRSGIVPIRTCKTRRAGRPGASPRPRYCSTCSRRQAAPSAAHWIAEHCAAAVWESGGTAAGADPWTAGVLDEAVTALRDAARRSSTRWILSAPPTSATPEFSALRQEFKHDLNAYLHTLGPGQPRPLAEVIGHNVRKRGAGNAAVQPGRVRGRRRPAMIWCARRTWRRARRPPGPPAVPWTGRQRPTARYPWCRSRRTQRGRSTLC